MCSCIGVLVVSIFDSFYDFSIEFSNFSESVVFLFCFHFIRNLHAMAM